MSESQEEKSAFVQELRDKAARFREQKKESIWRRIPVLVEQLKEDVNKQASNGFYCGTLRPHSFDLDEVVVEFDYLLEPFQEELQKQLPKGIKLDDVNRCGITYWF